MFLYLSLSFTYTVSLVMTLCMCGRKPCLDIIFLKNYLGLIISEINQPTGLQHDFVVVSYLLVVWKEVQNSVPSTL